jgi:hypothetical protein
MAASLSASESVTIGAGGAGGNGATPTSGTSGGTSSFGSHCSASGGIAGGLAAATSNIVFGTRGATGVGSGGDINLNGGYAEPGVYYTGVVGCGGRGGDAAFGFGYGGQIAAPASSSGPGVNAVGYGAGGSGGFASYFAGTQSANGGAGTSGIVIVVNYIG